MALVKKNIIYITAFLALFVLWYTHAKALIADTAINDQSEIRIIAGSYINNIAKLGLNISMKPGWHIYWRDPGDNGFPPTLDWNGSTNIAGVEFFWPAPTRNRQVLQPDTYTESYIYTDTVTFPITITPQDPTKPINLALHASYAICAETCIPAEADLSFNLQSGFYSSSNLEILNAAKISVPQANGTYGLRIETVNKGVFKDSQQQFIQIEAVNQNNKFKEGATIFIEGGEYYSFANPSVTINGANANFIVPITYLTSKKDFSGATLRITLVDGGNSVELTQNGDKLGTAAAVAVKHDQNYSISILVSMVLLAFIGGFILNIMPCVLPILSLKVLGIIKHGGDKKGNIRANLLITALGILVSFIALFAITVWLKASGQIVGWGFNFQEPYFIITLIIILTLFAANLWGLFEIRIPQYFTGLPNKYEGMAGHFMTGILATILATPCTAPFLGTAVGFSLTRGTFEILAIYTAMALGLAFPYLLLCLFPQLIANLPKPGRWMLKVKYFMGILLAVAATWLVWILSNQLGNLAAITLLLLCVAKILKLWAAKHYVFIQKIKTPLLLLIIIFAFTIPTHISDKSNLSHQEQAEEIWEEFKPENIPGLVTNGKVVFVDVTADWCLTCKANKFAVLDRAEIQDAFAKTGVVAMRANWTNKDNKITQYLMKYSRLGIPFNIIYGPGAPDGIVLSELLSKKEVLDALAKAR